MFWFPHQKALSKYVSAPAFNSLDEVAHIALEKDYRHLYHQKIQRRAVNSASGSNHIGASQSVGVILFG